MRDGDAVPLLGKAFDTLVLPVEGAGISLVRRALGGAGGVEIETVRRPTSCSSTTRRASQRE